MNEEIFPRSNSSRLFYISNWPEMYHMPAIKPILKGGLLPFGNTLIGLEQIRIYSWAGDESPSPESQEGWIDT